MSILASIRILHWPSEIQLHTIPETSESEDEASKQFSKLAEVISMMEKDNHSIVLETTDGYVSLTRKYLSDCILSLEVKPEEETDDDAG